MRVRALATLSLGLVILALLYLIAIPRFAERIPDTLEGATVARLQAQDMAWAEVHADGRDLLLRGEAPSPEAHRAAREVAKGVPGARRIVDGIRLRKVSPFRMSIVWQENGLEVAGYMPDEASLQALVARLRARPWAVTRDLAVANGSPSGWPDVVDGLLDAITGLDTARAELVDQQLSLTGRTTSVESRDRVLAALAGFERMGFRLDLQVTAKVSPYTFALAKRGETVQARGYVPDEASQRRLVETLTGTDDATVSEPIALRVAAGAPDGWMALLTALADGLVQFIDARAELTDRELELVGTMALTVQRDRLVAELRAYEQRGYRLNLDVTAADEEAVRCQTRIDQLLLTPIAFASGDARIGVESDALLQDLTDTLLSCPDARVLIAGHTDDRGREEDNLLLSRRRAEAVAARLIDAGVDRQRIETVGYGSQRPLADNDTWVGRAKNRRIEFVVEADR